MRAYQTHLQRSEDLITSPEATRAGFVALASEKNRKASPYVAEARALQQIASTVQEPIELLNIKGIEAALLTAAGLSDKALPHLSPQDKTEAIMGLIKKFLEPAGNQFIEELIFRFLLTRGDALGGSMRNVGGVLAQQKLTRAIIFTLTIGGLKYRWQHSKSRQWLEMSDDDAEIEVSLRGLSWQNENGNRTLIYNLTPPFIKNNVDICLFNSSPPELSKSKYEVAREYLALGELKGGIDPAGADEHWKTARTALERVRQAFSKTDTTPDTFFIGAAIEKKMSIEIWGQLNSGILSNAANLTNHKQLASLTHWLCYL